MRNLLFFLLFSGSVYCASKCDVSSITPSLVFQPPTGMKPAGLMLGMGIQNYTCSSDGTYTYVGALAQMYDISCQASATNFTGMRKRVPSYTNPDAVWYDEARNRAMLGDAKPVAMLSYVNNASRDSSLHPVFDFVSNYLQTGGSSIQTSVLVNISSPNPTQDISSQEMASNDGNTIIYQVDTHYGQAPSTCQPGSEAIEVRYSAKYWMYSAQSAMSGMIVKADSVNTQPATDSNSPDSATLQKILDYAPILLGLLAFTTLLSLLILFLGLFFVCKRRGSLMPTRSAPVYQPVQLSRAKEPMEYNRYHDEQEPYGA